MHFQFLAIVAGGIGPDVWDRELLVEGEDMTLRQALDLIEPQADELGGQIISIEQVD